MAGASADALDEPIGISEKLIRTKQEQSPMPRSPARPFDSAQQARLLQALGEARALLIASAEGMPRRSVPRASLELLVANIDDAAQILTGEREYFWRRPHATPGE